MVLSDLKFIRCYNLDIGYRQWSKDNISFMTICQPLSKKVEEQNKMGIYKRKTNALLSMSQH